MSDDREQFETEQVSRDREGDLDQEAWALQEDEGDRRTRVDCAIERLDAEVAAHEGDDELVCPACNRPHALHGIGCPTLSTGENIDPDTIANGIDASTGLSLGGPIVEPAAGKARFGDRVRDLWRRNPDLEASGLRLILSDLAAAIDRDAAEYDAERGRLAAALAESDTDRDRLAAKLSDLRRQVEEAVERQGFGAVGRDGLARDLGLAAADSERKRWLDVGLFLEALGAIFGEWAVSSEWREMASAWNKAMAEGLTEAARASAAAAWSEHELPHDRRERESARHEDSEGRVEGVDR